MTPDFDERARGLARAFFPVDTERQERLRVRVESLLGAAWNEAIEKAAEVECSKCELGYPVIVARLKDDSIVAWNHVVDEIVTVCGAWRIRALLETK